MLAGLVLVMPLADLLLDLLGDEVNGGVKIFFQVLGKQIRAGQRNAHGTGKLALGRFGLIMVERDAGIDGESVQMLQFLDSADKVIFNGFGQGHIMRRKD